MSAPTSHVITAQDGRKLFVRNYGSASATALPVVCLAGLARSSRDFEVLASALANDPNAPRRVIAPDMRGRGRSEYDGDPANYNLAVELQDVLAVLTALGIGRAVFVGTSRGGILSMLLATVQPQLIAGCVLNDIGPELDLAGLMRIKGYVGKLPQPANFKEAADLLRRLFGGQFTRLSDDDWLAYARRTYKEDGGRLVPDYDVKLGTLMENVSLEQPLPALWKEFDALAATPLMVIRGANSDLLSSTTVAAMQARKPSLVVLEVPDQGHAPLLAEPDVIARIAAFIADCDRKNSNAVRPLRPPPD
jgi:pimeloyl-ACP methyl ester carboxylesterase